jgi:hypothetical protein
MYNDTSSKNNLLTFLLPLSAIYIVSNYTICEA